MGVPVIETGPMSVKDFLAFTQTRPDDEDWELIGGEPVLNAWPSYTHQRIVMNVLMQSGMQLGAQSPWEVLPGLGVRVSDADLPVPDVLIRPRRAPRGGPGSRECDDMIVAVEVLSPSTEHRDLRWKRNAYTSLPSLARYVVIAQDAVEAVVFERASAGFAEHRFNAPDASIDMPEIGIALPLADIYRDTGLHLA